MLSALVPPSQAAKELARPAVSQTVRTKLSIMIQTGMDTVLPTGPDVVEAIAACLSKADKQTVVNSIGSGSRLGAYCNNPDHIDRRPYTVALESNFPGWTSNPFPVLKLGLSHQSMPLVVAALVIKREDLSTLIEQLTIREVILLLRLLWLAMACPDMRPAFIQ